MTTVKKQAAIEFGTMRFNEIRKYIGGISFKALSTAPKDLEIDQLARREEHLQIPPKV